MKKQNKIILGIIFGILLIGIATAGVLQLRNKDKVVPYNQTITDALATKNITSWRIEDYNNSNEMKRCLISESDYNLPCSSLMNTYYMNCTLRNETTRKCINEVRIDYTEQEKDAKLDNWENRTINIIGNAIISREQGTLVKSGEGLTTIIIE